MKIRYKNWIWDLIYRRGGRGLFAATVPYPILQKILSQDSLISETRSLVGKPEFSLNVKFGRRMSSTKLAFKIGFDET